MKPTSTASTGGASGSQPIPPRGAASTDASRRRDDRPSAGVNEAGSSNAGQPETAIASLPTQPATQMSANTVQVGEKSTWLQRLWGCFSGEGEMTLNADHLAPAPRPTIDDLSAELAPRLDLSGVQNPYDQASNTGRVARVRDPVPVGDDVQFQERGPGPSQPGDFREGVMARREAVNQLATQITNELAALEVERDQLQQALGERDQLLRIAGSEVGALERANNRISQESQELQQRVAQLESRTEHLNQLVEARGVELQEARNLIANQDGAIQVLLTDLQDAENLAAQQQAEIQELQNVFVAAGDVIVDQETQMQALQQELENAANVIANRDSEVRQLHDAVGDALNIIVDQEAEINDLREEVDVARVAAQNALQQADDIGEWQNQQLAAALLPPEGQPQQVGQNQENVVEAGTLVLGNGHGSPLVESPHSSESLEAPPGLPDGPVINVESVSRGSSVSSLSRNLNLRGELALPTNILENSSVEAVNFLDFLPQNSKNPTDLVTNQNNTTHPKTTSGGGGSNGDGGEGGNGGGGNNLPRVNNDGPDDGKGGPFAQPFSVIVGVIIAVVLFFKFQNTLFDVPEEWRKKVKTEKKKLDLTGILRLVGRLLQVILGWVGVSLLRLIYGLGTFWDVLREGLENALRNLLGIRRGPVGEALRNTVFEFWSLIALLKPVLSNPFFICFVTISLIVGIYSFFTDPVLFLNRPDVVKKILEFFDWLGFPISPTKYLFLNKDPMLIGVNNHLLVLFGFFTYQLFNRAFYKTEIFPLMDNLLETQGGFSKKVFRFNKNVMLVLSFPALAGAVILGLACFSNPVTNPLLSSIIWILKDNATLTIATNIGLTGLLLTLNPYLFIVSVVLSVIDQALLPYVGIPQYITFIESIKQIVGTGWNAIKAKF